MEKTPELDNIFKEIIGSTENHYQEYSGEAKDRIWGHISRKGIKKVVPIWAKWTIAASFLGIVSLSYFLFRSQKENKQIVNQLAQEVERLKQESMNPGITPVTTQTTDTFFKEKVVYVPIVSTVQEEKIKYVYDTITVNQSIIEIADPKPDSIKRPDDVPMADYRAVEIILDNQPAKKAKKEKFKLSKLFPHDVAEMSTAQENSSIFDLLSKNSK